jgi:hypothetical protein
MTGSKDGYKVLSIVSDGTQDGTRIQVQGTYFGAIVWNLLIGYWFEEGIWNPMNRQFERMVKKT